MTKEDKLQIVIDVVCKHYDVSQRELCTPSHARRLSEPRHVIFYLARQMVNLPLQRVADRFNRAHSTVIHGANVIKGLVQMNGFSKVTDEMTEKINIKFGRKSEVKRCPYCHQPIFEK